MAERNGAYSNQSAYFDHQPESARPRMHTLPSIQHIASPGIAGYPAPYSPLLAMDHVPMAGPSSSEGTTPPAEYRQDVAVPSPMLTAKDKAGGASDFVKKLYRMLEDAAHAQTVGWNDKGDSFVVKDMNDFTKSILPKHFKHSNFASFVRQLNKYDFHKVKKPESSGETGVYGDHIWEFRHPHFRADMKSDLENIKRKIPVPKKTAPVASATSKASGSGSKTAQVATSSTLSTHSHSAPREDMHISLSDPVYINLQRQLDALAQDQHNLVAHVNNLSRDYQTVTSKMNNFQRNFSTQDQMIQQLIQYLYNVERNASTNDNPSPGENNNYVPSPEVQRLVSAYQEASRVTFEQLDDTTRRSSLLTGRLVSNALRPGSPGSGGHSASPRSANLGQSPHSSGPFSSESSYLQAGPFDQMSRHSGSAPQNHHQSMDLKSQGSQQEVPSQNSYSFMHQQQMPFNNNNMHQPAQTALQQNQAGQMAKTPSSGWAVAPKVLLVEDDPVCRKLSSKFLQVFGCQIDVAEDGVSAVNKVNMEKYDLVFMDIMMPHLDGVSATSLIRQFDPTTPIISMTSNSDPQEILTYFSHGMNDILPKPFTKEGLLGMLDKHLIHLKQMQSLTEIPRALGISDDAIKSALVTTFSDPSANNPFADMVNDADYDYVHMLAALVNGNMEQTTPGRTQIDSGQLNVNNKRDMPDGQGFSGGKRQRYDEM